MILEYRALEQYFCVPKFDWMMFFPVRFVGIEGWSGPFRNDTTRALATMYGIAREAPEQRLEKLALEANVYHDVSMKRTPIRF